MDDLISRKAAIKGLLSMCPEKTEPGSFDEYGVTVLCGAVDVVIKGLPAVDAVPVVHGRWIIDTAFGNDVMSNGRMVLCSECGQGRFTGKTYYCPNCGAKMDGERRKSE